MLYIWNMKLLLLSLSLLFLGCAAEQKFIAIGAPQTLQPKQMKDILVFWNSNQVPWKYKELGEIMPSGQLKQFQTIAVQLDDIKREAAKNGADAVILTKSVGQRGALYANNQFAFADSQSFIALSGTAIIRNDDVSFVPK